MYLAIPSLYAFRAYGCTSKVHILKLVKDIQRIKHGFLFVKILARAGARVDDIYSHDPSVVLVTWHLGYDCDLCNGCRVEGAAVPVQQGLDPLPQ